MPPKRQQNKELSETAYPPQQLRSEGTMRRMIEAAREALAERPADKLTVAEVARRAGVTTGAIYARFPSKEALLRHLEQGTLGAVQERMAELFAAHADDDRDLEQVVRDYIGMQAATYREHRGMMRELVIGSWSDAEKHARRMDATRRVLDAATSWMLQRPGAIGHPRPKAALKVALLFATAALRDVVLFEDTWVMGGDGVSSPQELEEELVQAVLAHIKYHPPPRA
jgi:AcrR family transcriptional regulator